MTQQTEAQERLEKAAALFRQTYIKTWVSDWWAEVIERREVVTPSDWMNAAIVMIEILIDAQELEAERREKLAFEVVEELHRRISVAPQSNAKS